MKKNLKKFSKLEINNLSWKEMKSITAGAGTYNATVWVSKKGGKSKIEVDHIQDNG